MQGIFPPKDTINNNRDGYMKNLKLISTILFSTLLAACDHPIEIAGEGNVVSASGSRNCSLADFQAAKGNCTKNTVVGAYKETYTAQPLPGWTFQGWEGTCSAFGAGKCTFDVAGGTVSANWGKTMPAMVAVFRPDVAGSTKQFLYTGGDQQWIFKANAATGALVERWRWTRDLTQDGTFQNGISDLAFVGEQAYALSVKYSDKYILRVDFTAPFFATKVVFDMHKAFPLDNPISSPRLDDYSADFIDLNAHGATLYARIKHRLEQRLLAIDAATMTVLRESIPIVWEEDEFDWKITAMAFNDAGQLIAVGSQRAIDGSTKHLVWQLNLVTGKLTKVRELVKTVHEYLSFEYVRSIAFTNVGLLGKRVDDHLHVFDIGAGTIVEGTVLADGYSTDFLTAK